MPATRPDATIVIPTRNERDNVATLVRRLNEAFHLAPADSVEIFFIDDSDDDTPEAVHRAALSSRLPVRLLHRDPDARADGLSGAVALGLSCSEAARVVVMDADLQHPPALAPQLCARLDEADVVVASRYCGAGDASGLSSSFRRSVSTGSVLLARACFPRRVGRSCTDPMTGFFAVRREAVDLTRLRPRGFKILLEILANHDLEVVEVPFTFGERHGGRSKASWHNGAEFLSQLLALRMGRMPKFALVGAVGALVNLLVMYAVMLVGGGHFLLAALIAAEVSITQNFILQEIWVFPDLRNGGKGLIARAGASVAYNNIDALMRLPCLYVMVNTLALAPLVAQAMLLGGAFFARFLFVSVFVYNARPASSPPRTDIASKQRGVVVNRTVG
ncbi:glycosyltransferase family 2 protein [soil metagenome]